MTPNDVASLQASVIERAQQVAGRQKANLEDAMAGGRELFKIREALDYGEWMRWLGADFPLEKSSAYNWIKLAEHQDVLDESSSAGNPPRSIRAALEIIRASTEADAEPDDDDDGGDEPTANEPLPPAVLRTGDVVMFPRATPRGIWPNEHVLICGDSTVVRKALGGVRGDRPRILVSDPPYGILIDAWDSNADWRQAWSNFPGHHGFVFYGLRKRAIAQEALEAVGFIIADELTWNRRTTTEWRKRAGIRHRADYIFRVERAGHHQHWVPGRPLDSPLRHVLSPEERAEARPHKTPKPVALIADLIRSASREGDVVLDPFCGSGATLLASEETGRRCLAVEKEAAYCDLIVRRWQTRTGRQAMLWQGGTRDPIPVDDLRHDDERFQPLNREPQENPLTPESLPSKSIRWVKPG